MFVAFFESIKYVGHLFPIALLRFFMGSFYLQLAVTKFNGDYLVRPRLAAQIADVLPVAHVPTWYRHLIEVAVIPNWQTFAFIITGLEFTIAISYLLGYVVRPVAFLAAFLSLNMMILSGASHEDLYRTFIVIHLTLAWLGAGRCLGFDYYFFKRRRGLWW